MPMPVLRTPVVLDGYRGTGVGDPSKSFRLLVDLKKLEPKEGQYAFLSPSNDLRLLLRGATTIKTRGGIVTGEVEPLEVKFESGFLVIEDAETNELLMKHKKRGQLFFAYEDVVGMQDDANDKKIEEVLNSVSEKGLEKLRQRLDAKGFGLPVKGKKSA